MRLTSLYMAGFYCLRPAASHILFIMLLSLTFLLKGASIGSLAFSFKTGLLNQKVIVDFQDFGLVTEARPQTAGRAVAQFKTACHRISKKRDITIGLGNKKEIDLFAKST